VNLQQRVTSLSFVPTGGKTAATILDPLFPFLGIYDLIVGKWFAASAAENLADM